MNPIRLYSISRYFIAIIKARLLGYSGANGDLKYLIYRSNDVIKYLSNEFLQQADDIEKFYDRHKILSTKVCFDDFTVSPTWKARDAHKAAGLARYLVLSQISKEHVIVGLNLYGYLLENSKNKVFRNRVVEPHLQHHKVFLDGLYSVGALEEWESTYRALFSQLKNFQSVKCDLENPFIGLKADVNTDYWLKQFNNYFNSFGLQEIELRSNGISPFDQLSTNVSKKVQGPMVTVIVSAFNSGPELITSVQSLLDQTWENIEIIIVDDSSTQTSYIDMAKEMDPRIRVLRQSENLGTYAARNLGIHNSAGLLITTHDSDDWAHPERIEIQAKDLLASEDNLANLSWCIRVSNDLMVSTLGFSETRINSSSLMFKKELVKLIGYFDEVRKGADSEYRKRIEAKFPNSISVIGLQPLSIIRIGHESLSRSDFTPLWVHPNRHFYKQSYEAWHESGNLNGFELPMYSNPYRLPFPSPIAWLNDSNLFEVKVFDVVVAANFSKEFVPNNLGLKHVAQFIKNEMHVGVLNLRSLKLSEPFDPEFQELVSAYKIHYLSQDTVTTVKKLVVVDCEYLLLRCIIPQLLEVEEVQIHVKSFQVLLERFQTISGTTISLNDEHEIEDFIHSVEENVMEQFRKTPTWFFYNKADFNLLDSLSVEKVLHKQSEQ